jgi:transcriptional regulator with XRE-family HTH domain
VNNIGFSVKSAIEASGMSAKNVAERAKIHLSVMYRILADESDPQAGTLAKIASVLNVSLAYLLATPAERLKLDAKVETNAPLPDVNTGVTAAILQRLEALESMNHQAHRGSPKERILALLENRSQQDAIEAETLLKGYFAGAPRAQPHKKKQGT